MLPYILGIDIGTGSTKGVAVNRQGKVVGTSQIFYPEKESHAEQDPQVIWNAFVQCTHEVQQKVGAAPEAVSLSSAMHSIMAVNGDEQPVSPLLTWADDRAAQIALDLSSNPLGKELYERCGTPIHALSPLCKIAWWQQNDPKLFNAAHKFIGVKEWIWYRLFGTFEIDLSLASATGMLHLQDGAWYAPALQFAGIEAERLSQPVDTAFTRNEMLPDAAQATGLPQDTVFVIGASDGCLANLGTGALAKGVAAATIGTSGAVRVAAAQPCPQWPEQLFNYYLTQNTWITGGAINNGGAAVSWFAELLYPEGLKDAPFEALPQIAPGADGLLFLPFLMGERAPIWDSNSSAAFIGLRDYHTKTHLLRAVLEGVCFALRSVLESLEKASGAIEKLHLSGGFSRSAEALQLLADCTGKKVVRLQAEDASAVGAAYLAFKVVGWVKDFSALPESASVETFHADAAKHRQYTQVYDLYRGLYPVLKETMHALRKFEKTKD